MTLPALELQDLTPPVDWDRIFGSSGPLELEIGAGRGGFAAAWGLRFPERRLVALEARRTYAEETRGRVEKAGARNVLALHADAKLCCPRLFAPASLSGIHVYFPDPWWKRRHFKRRIVEPAFCKVMLALLEPGGVLHLRTDVEERAQEMLKDLRAAGFVNPLGDAFAPYDPDEVATTRERRYLAGGAPVWRLHVRRP